MGRLAAAQKKSQDTALQLQQQNATPAVADQEMTPLVKKLLAHIDVLVEALQRANSEIQQMRDEIAVLKGQKGRPKFKSSKMDQNTDKDNEQGDDQGASPQDGKCQASCRL